MFFFRNESGIEWDHVDPALLVIAKQPVPGRVKTRLCPPCTPEQAAELAAAALCDTLAAVADTPAASRILVFEGDPDAWAPPDFVTLTQRGNGLGERLAAAFSDVFVDAGHRGPVLLVGMDTPQLTSAHLVAALAQLRRPGIDAVIAPTFDGGYWCVGFNAHVTGAFDGVPMSTEQTYERQLERFGQLGLSVAITGSLRDVDTIAEAYRVAAEAPDTRFAAALALCDPSGVLTADGHTTADRFERAA